MSRKICLFKPLRLGFVAAVAVTSIVAMLASTASAAVVQRAPANGAVVNGDIHLVLRAPALVPVWVRLNGRAVTLPPPLRDGRMDLWLSPAEGLRRGANTLAVGLGENSRALVRRRFRLTSRLPLAAAADVSTSPDSPVTLNAGAVKDAAGGPLRYQWQLVSSAHGVGVPRSGSGRRLVLDPRALGRVVYRVRVAESSSRGAAAASAASSTEYVTASVEPASPLVAIDTNRAASGFPGGIKVGATTYAPAAPEGGEHPVLQVVALDRGTLALIRNFTIGCAAADAACGTSISDKLAALGNALVIASVHSGYLMSDAELAGLKAIGGPTNATPPSDGFAVIGVPGMSAGSGWWSAAPGPGRLRGYATQDSWGNWTYTAGDPVAFDTEPSPKSPDYIGIRVGHLQFNHGTPQFAGSDCVSGRATEFAQLLVLDRFRLDPGTSVAPIVNHVYAVDCLSSLDAMTTALGEVKSGEIVFLYDRDGLPAQNGTAFLQARGRLADAVQLLGGIRDTVLRVQEGEPYSLVGRPGLQPGQGLEASRVLSNGQDDGRLAGTLSRDQTNGYTVDTASSATGPENQISSLLYQFPQQWPLLDTEAHKQALAWVDDQVDAGGNLRTDYWQQGWSDAVWNNKAENIRALAFPGPGHGFEQTDLTAVKDELVKEIGWLISVRSYFARLGAPYTDGALASQAELQKIAGKVQDGVQPPAADTTLPWLSFAGEIGGLVATVGGFSKTYANAFRGLATIVSTLKAGVALARTTTGKPVSDADYRAKVADLGVTLADNIQRSKDALKRMQSIIVGDYGKLKTLGELGDCSQTSPICPEQWQLPASTESFARSMLIIQAKRSFYSALLPLKFELDNLSPSPTGFLDQSARTWWCGENVGRTLLHPSGYVKHYRFIDEPDSGFVQTYFVQPGSARWNTWALRVPGPVDAEKFQTPAASLLNPLFAPVDLENPTGDNLGLIKIQFYLDTWGKGKRVVFHCYLP